MGGLCAPPLENREVRWAGAFLLGMKVHGTTELSSRLERNRISYFALLITSAFAAW
jgi:hypothetical protein